MALWNIKGLINLNFWCNI